MLIAKLLICAPVSDLPSHGLPLFLSDLLPLRRGGSAARQLTAKERQQQRRSIVWLSMAVGAIVVYVLLSGQLIRIGVEYDEDDEADE